MAAPPDEPPPFRYDGARTVALSDGVFAIALTLLVLSITFPHLAAGHSDDLSRALWDRRDEMLSWLLSFVVIALMWIRHHTFFTHVRELDARMVWLNFVFLGGVAFLPYPTQILGAYGHEPAAVGLYGVTLAIISGASALMIRRAARADMLSPAGRARYEELVAHQPWWLMPALFLLAFPLSFAWGSAATAVWAAPAVISRVRRRSGRRPPASASR